MYGQNPGKRNKRWNNRQFIIHNVMEIKHNPLNCVI